MNNHDVRQVTFRQWLIESDTESTRLAYVAMKDVNTDPCVCETCQNFVAAKEQGLVYPQEVLAFFTMVGIDVEQVTELLHYGQVEKGLHLYAGWFPFIGTVTTGSDAKQQVGQDAWHIKLEAVDEHFSLGFTNQVDLVPESFRTQSTAQIEFQVQLPWLLKTPEPL